VIESLQSRFTIIKINPLKRVNMIKILNNIKTSENITITNEAQNFIIDICNNNVKILLNYLEKIITKYLKETGLSKNQHKKNITKNIKWTN
jgi:DNA polymerase III delta prime subunit